MSNWLRDGVAHLLIGAVAFRTSSVIPASTAVAAARRVGAETTVPSATTALMRRTVKVANSFVPSLTAAAPSWKPRVAVEAGFVVVDAEVDLLSDMLAG